MDKSEALGQLARIKVNLGIVRRHLEAAEEVLGEFRSRFAEIESEPEAADYDPDETQELGLRPGPEVIDRR